MMVNPRESESKGRTLPSLPRERIAYQALLINACIGCLAFVAPLSEWPAVIGGLLVILYLSNMALKSPKRAFFLIFGVKLTFDVLWFARLQVPVVRELGMLDLFIVPIMIVIASFGPAGVRSPARWLVIGAGFYLVWTLLATVLNGYRPDLELAVRQSGILIGLLMGFRFLRSEEDFHLLMYLVWISTVIPVFGSIFQMGAHQFGISILHYKIDTIRSLRLSGFYYDPAATGMVNIIAMLSNLYLLRTDLIAKKNRKYHHLLLALSVLIILVGGTRTMIIASVLIVMLSIPRSIKGAVQIAIPVLLAVIVAKPYLEAAIARTSFENRRAGIHSVKLQQVLYETEYRTMFSGRINIWQSIWRKFRNSSPEQRLFGSGITSNAHSSYFFLLLQIGWLGLAYYLFLHLRIVFDVWRLKGTYRLVLIISTLSILLVGTSATVVMYTSYQWFSYLLIGGAFQNSPGRRT